MVDPMTAMGATGVASRTAAGVPAAVGKVYTYASGWVALCGGLSVLAHVGGNAYAPAWFVVRALELVGLEASWVVQVQVWLIAHPVVGNLAAGFSALIYVCHCGGVDALSKRAPVTAALWATIAIQAGAMAWWMLPVYIAAGAIVEWVKTRQHSTSTWSNSYPDVGMYLSAQILTFVAAPLATYAWFISADRHERHGGPDTPTPDPIPAARGAAIRAAVAKLERRPQNPSRAPHLKRVNTPRQVRPRCPYTNEHRELWC